MYNVFKRPMFKRGGTAQGSGIMSTVEPKPQPRIMAQGGYFTDTPFGQLLSSAGNEMKKPAAAIYDLAGVPLNKVSEFFTGYNPGFSGSRFFNIKGVDQDRAPFIGIDTIAKEGFYKDRQGIASLDDTFLGPGDTSKAATIKPGETAADAVFNRAREKNAEETINNLNQDKINQEVKVDARDVMRKEVEDEAAFLKDILKDKDYNKAELALILAESLATPGGINKKLDTARKLGAEVARTQRKEDKAVTLEAYKRFKEREREQIKAGKDNAPERLINQRIDSIMKTAKKVTKGPGGETLYDGQSQDEIRERVLSNYFKEDKYDESLAKLRLSQEGPDLSKAIIKINELQNRIEKGESLSKEDLATLAKKSQYVKGYSKLPGFKDVFGPQLAKPEYIGGYSIGGRVKLAEGGMGDDEEVDDIVTSEVASDGNETAIKPVMKLSYQELRSRLPQEITNDVVTLLANNEQALQDFAYLQTQQDVGNFNVKYGVNLVLPPQS